MCLKMGQELVSRKNFLFVKEKKKNPEILSLGPDLDCNMKNWCVYLFTIFHRQQKPTHKKEFKL